MKNEKFKVEYDIEKDGITQGLILRKWTCPEKARHFLRRLERIGTRETLPLAFGTVAHELLQRTYFEFGKEKKTNRQRLTSRKHLESVLSGMYDEWQEENPRAAAEEVKVRLTAHEMAAAVMPHYFAYWARDLVADWIAVEQKFALPYELEDGRKTVLRGAMDAGFLENSAHKKGKTLTLLETKTKARIDTIFLEDWLPMDIQTCMYLWAMRRLHPTQVPEKLLYNLIRRPQLRLKKEETTEQFGARIVDDIEERPEHYFQRVPMKVTKQMMDNFEVRLEAIVQDIYDWWQGKSAHYRNSGACEGFGICPMFEACAGRWDVYRQRKHLYRELAEEGDDE